jgi:hypothetical protein
MELIDRNRDVLAPIIQAKFDAGQCTDYVGPFRLVSGNDKLIVIDRADLRERKLR